MTTMYLLLTAEKFNKQQQQKSIMQRFIVNINKISIEINKFSFYSLFHNKSIIFKERMSDKSKSTL